MDKIYRYLFIAVTAVGILFGLQYFLPITAQYLHIKGVSGIPGLPSMPTVAYQPTAAPLPVTPLQVEDTFGTQVAVLVTALPIPGAATTTATLQVGGTASLTPSATLTPAPGITLNRPSATTRPVSTATRTLTVATVESGGQPCNNVLFPIQTGQQWLYQVTTSSRTLNVNMVAAAVSGANARIDVTDQSTNLFKETLVECDNGAILSIPSIVFDNILGAVNVQYVSGLFLPSQATLTANNWFYSWRGNYSASGNVTMAYQGTNANLTLNNSALTLTCHTIGSGNAAFEAVSVPGKSVPAALKVICNVEVPVTGAVNGFSLNGTLTGQSTLWFGLGIGLLKMQVDDVTLHAIGLSLSPTVNAQVVLVSMNPTH